MSSSSRARGIWGPDGGRRAHPLETKLTRALWMEHASRLEPSHWGSLLSWAHCVRADWGLAQAGPGQMHVAPATTVLLTRAMPGTMTGARHLLSTLYTLYTHYTLTSSIHVSSTNETEGPHS